MPMDMSPRSLKDPLFIPIIFSSGNPKAPVGADEVKNIKYVLVTHNHLNQDYITFSINVKNVYSNVIYTAYLKNQDINIKNIKITQLNATFSSPS